MLNPSGFREGLNIGGASQDGVMRLKRESMQKKGPSGISEPGQDEKGTFPVGIQP